MVFFFPHNRFQSMDTQVKVFFYTKELADLVQWVFLLQQLSGFSLIGYSTPKPAIFQSMLFGQGYFCTITQRLAYRSRNVYPNQPYILHRYAQVIRATCFTDIVLANYISNILVSLQIPNKNLNFLSKLATFFILNFNNFKNFCQFDFVRGQHISSEGILWSTIPLSFSPYHILKVSETHLKQ